MQGKFSEISKKFSLDFLFASAKVPDVMKKALMTARDSLQKSLLDYLAGRPEHVGEHVSAMVADAFAPLLKTKPVTKSILAAQIGDQGFRIERTTNFLDLRVGKTITREEAEKLIADGIPFTVCRNK